MLLGVVLSIARSRFAVPSQLLFLALNGCGIFFGIFYNVNTADLYQNNAHHKIGWIATWVVTVQVAMSLLFAFSGRSEQEDTLVSVEEAAFSPISVEAMAQHQQLHNPPRYKEVRWSGDSGQGTECASSSQHSPDLSPADEILRRQEFDVELEKPEREDENEESEQLLSQHKGLVRITFIHKFLKRQLPGLFSRRALKVLETVYDGVDRMILLLGFIALVTGGVTYAGIFVSKRSFAPIYILS
jgi:Domain of unknown function (DUF2427)